MALRAGGCGRSRSREVAARKEKRMHDGGLSPSPPDGPPVAEEPREDARGERDVDHAEIIEPAEDPRQTGTGGGRERQEERAGEDDRPRRPRPRIAQGGSSGGEEEDGSKPSRGLAREEYDGE